MAEEGGLRGVVAREVTDQLEASDLLGEGSLEESIEGDELGAALGRELGERLGRAVGASIGREVHEAFSDRESNDDRDGAVSTLVTAIRDGVDDAFTGDGIAPGLEGALEDEGSDAEPADAAGGGEEGEESTADEDDEAPSAADLEELREETLTEFLGVLSYEDLQSIAKDVDVRANLSREEMTERIIETVGDGGESDDDE